jgi:nucleotide-binding universal stress UspA family protein
MGGVKLASMVVAGTGARLSGKYAIGFTATPRFWPYVIGVVRERWIVVGTDFSPGARGALDGAMGWAEGLGARIALVHAFEEAPGASADDDPTPKLLVQLAREIVLSRTSGPGVHVEPLVRRGRPWEKILNVATQYGADLIVVGSTGQSGATLGLPLGSVVSRVVALSTRSVVVARAHLAASRGA